MTGGSARPAPPAPGGAALLPAFAAAALFGAALAGCAQPGDLGRARPSVVNDRLMPVAGGALARGRGEAVSAYRLTDDEREMRDLGWAVVMPPLERQWIARTLVELRRTRILPADRARIDKAAYVRALIATPYRSSAARYARLKDDIEADTYRIEPFFRSAEQVAIDDRARDRALVRVPEVRPDEAENANARIEENGLMIAWVRESFGERLTTYRYALDRLVLETPDRAAAEVEAALAGFEMALASLRPLGAPRGVFKG